jgi:hypothetical protein
VLIVYSVWSGTINPGANQTSQLELRSPTIQFKYEKVDEPANIGKDGITRLLLAFLIFPDGPDA